jgi:hypothetical protein
LPLHTLQPHEPHTFSFQKGVIRKKKKTKAAAPLLVASLFIAQYKESLPWLIAILFLKGSVTMYPVPDVSFKGRITRSEVFDEVVSEVFIQHLTLLKPFTQRIFRRKSEVVRRMTHRTYPLDLQ